ncbi:hypothetical protein ABZV14_40845, partial [Streptosporangium canum]
CPPTRSTGCRPCTPPIRRPESSSWRTRSKGDTYVDPDNQLVGILLTQTGMSTPDSARAIHDFWTTLYQAVDD